MWVPEAAHFFLKRRESEPSQVVVCCLALFGVSQICDHVYVHIQPHMLYQHTMAT